MSVEWRLIPGHEFYEVSEHGDIRRAVKGKCTYPGRLRKLSEDKNGYLIFNYQKNGRRINLKSHRCVAIAFIGFPPSKKHEVAHNDGSKTNNHFSNLRWATPKENQLDRTMHGTDSKGSDRWCAKLSESDVLNIRERLNCGEMGKDLSVEYGVSKSLISLIRNNKKWKHLSG